MKDFVVAIDGPAASGKSSVSQRVAEALGIRHLSTGMIFRALAYCVSRVDPKDEKAVKDEIRQFKLYYDDGHFVVNNLNITTNLLSDSLSMPASIISAYPFVRKIYKQIVDQVVSQGSIVLDGRDIGSVVCPDAEFKFYLDATPEVRAKRRANELNTDNKKSAEKQILQDLIKRDKQDKTRKIAPLKRAKGAIYIDTSDMTKEEVVEKIVKEILSKQRDRFTIH